LDKIVNIYKEKKENNDANKKETKNLDSMNDERTNIEENEKHPEVMAHDHKINSEKERSDNEISNQEEIINFKFDNENPEDLKGRFKIRDSSLYELKSIYRKRDKFSKVQGISLQMGTHETTHKEEVLSIFLCGTMILTLLSALSVAIVNPFFPMIAECLDL